MIRRIKTFETLTKEDIEYIKKECEKGTKYRIIGAHLFVSADTARNWAIKLGAKSRINHKGFTSKEMQIVNLAKTHNTVESIAEEVDTSVGYVVTILKKHNISGFEHELKINYNSNPPTETTDMLIRNYYLDDVVRKQMKHDDAIMDIMILLGRQKEYIEKTIKNIVINEKEVNKNDRQ